MGGDVKTIDKPRGMKMPATHAAHSVTPDDLAQLRESAACLQTLVDSAGVLMWTSGTDGARDYFNQAWLDFTGAPWRKRLATAGSAACIPMIVN